MTRRMLLPLGLVLLVGAQAVVLWITRGREPAEFRSLRCSLSQMPVQLGPWQSVDEQMDPRVAVAVEASDVVNRRYKDASGTQINVQIAAFSTKDTDPPHNPQVCYTASGWKVVERRWSDLRVDADTTRPARLLILEQDRQRILVLYWYQFGDAHVFDADTFRAARWKLFGQKRWPSLLKVLIQVNASDPVRAERALRTFAEFVLAWTKEIS